MNGVVDSLSLRGERKLHSLAQVGLGIVGRHAKSSPFTAGEIDPAKVVPVLRIAKGPENPGAIRRKEDLPVANHGFARFRYFPGFEIEQPEVTGEEVRGAVESDLLSVVRPGGLNVPPSVRSVDAQGSAGYFPGCDRSLE